MSGGSSDESSPISCNALGNDVRVGMLYDCRSKQFFSGFSLWKQSKLDEYCKPSNSSDSEVLNCSFEISSSLEEAHEKAGIDAEASLALKLKMIEVSGSAKYLSDNYTREDEVAVNLTCNVVKHTKFIPSDLLNEFQLDYPHHLENSSFTHFVSEVTEGGSATLTFAQRKSSKSDKTDIQGAVQITINAGSVKIDGKASVKLNTLVETKSESLKIKYCGTEVLTINTIEEAAAEIPKLPTKLRNHTRPLSYKLLPLSLLSSNVSRAVRGVNDKFLSEVTGLLTICDETDFKLAELLKCELYEKFPSLKEQVTEAKEAFLDRLNDFRALVVRFLPLIYDQSARKEAEQLMQSVSVLRKSREFVERFLSKKNEEIEILTELLASAEAQNFKIALTTDKRPSILKQGAVRLVLSIGGSEFSNMDHPLLKSIRDPSLRPDNKYLEWYDNIDVVEKLHNNFDAMMKWKELHSDNVIYAITYCPTAYSSDHMHVQTQFGDLLLDNRGIRHILSANMLLSPSPAPQVTTTNVSMQVKCSKHDVPGTIAYIIGLYDIEQPAKVQEYNIATESIDTVSVFQRSQTVDYEIKVCVETIFGRLSWSEPVKVFMSCHGYYLKNCATLDWVQRADKLYLSCKPALTDKGIPEVNDVAMELKPEVSAHPMDDKENTRVIIFTGKWEVIVKQINAFVSYLLGDEPSDKVKLSLIDESKFNDDSKKSIHCFRIRPLSRRCEGKTVVIVAIPTRAPVDKELEDLIYHLNMIFLTIDREEKVDSPFLDIVDKNAFKSLGTIVTECDNSEPNIAELLPKGWLIETNFVKVAKDKIVSLYERFSTSQQEIFQTVLTSSAVPLKEVIVFKNSD